MTPDADQIVTVDGYLKAQPPATRRLLQVYGDRLVERKADCSASRPCRIAELQTAITEANAYLAEMEEARMSRRSVDDTDPIANLRA